MQFKDLPPEARALNIQNVLVELLTSYKYAGEQLRRKQERYNPSVSPTMWHLAPLRELLAGSSGGKTGFMSEQEKVWCWDVARRCNVIADIVKKQALAAASGSFHAFMVRGWPTVLHVLPAGSVGSVE